MILCITYWEMVFFSKMECSYESLVQPFEIWPILCPHSSDVLVAVSQRIGMCYSDNYYKYLQA